MQLVSDPTGRTAGQHARAAVRRLRLRTLVALGVLGVGTAALGRTFGLHDLRFLGSEVALLVGIFVISRYVLPLVERRDRGASAEEHVGSLLDALPADEWRVIHDASVGHGNIDHIAIGPAGLFTIETKSHPGPVRVGRLHGATIRQAQAERKAVEQLTGLAAQPLLVFSRAWVDRPLARRKGVRVLPARMLLEHLSGLPPKLTPAEVGDCSARLTAALREYEQQARIVRGRRDSAAAR